MKNEQRLRDGIRKILNRDWNPIGLSNLSAVDNEYDSYISKLIKLLQEGAGDHKIAERLSEFEQVSMGLSKADRSHELVVQNLREMYSAIAQSKSLG
ncbi:MAG: hypothetical protein AAF333_07245 [Planctomycetota bacterium]